MLRILLIAVITYLVIRIALRLLLTESPAQRRNRMRDGQWTQYQTDGHGPRNNRQSVHPRIEEIEDAEFEEIPNDSDSEKNT